MGIPLDMFRATNETGVLEASLSMNESGERYTAFYLPVHTHMKNALPDSEEHPERHRRGDAGFLVAHSPMGYLQGALRHTHYGEERPVRDHRAQSPPSKGNTMDELDADSPEMIAFNLIAQAGDARSKSHEALTAAKTGNFDEAATLIDQADQALLEAHRTQTAILSKEAAGEHTEVNVLLVHAQDHLMTAILAKELIGEIIELHRVIAHKQ